MEGSETPKDAPEAKTKRDPDKLKETLNRMRSKKSMQQIDKPADGGGATETVGLVATSSALEEKRRQLKLLKQQSKLAEENSEDNKRPRSPSKGASRRGKSSMFSDADLDDDEDEEEDEEAENDKEEQKAEEPEDPVYQDIVRVEPPVQSFPLSFLPKWRYTENQQHPGVLLVPMPNPDIGNVFRPATVCVKSATNAVCTCFGCNEQFRRGSEPMWRGKQLRERDFLAQNQGRAVRGMSDLDRQHWVAQQEVAAPELRSLHKLIKKSFAEHDDNDENNLADNENEETSGLLDSNAGGGGAAGGTGAAASAAAGSKSHTVEDDLEDIYRKPYHENGMYLSNSSTLSQMLLYGEDTAPHLASMTPADLRLSRVTQRTLRELRNSLEEEKVRQHWQQLKREGAATAASGAMGGAGAAAVGGGLGPISEESEGPGEVYSATHPAPPAVVPTIPSQVNLLKQLATAPMLRMSENPLDTSYSQPVIPDPSEEYGGGELGQWGPEATLNERFGPLPHGWKDHGSLLRKGGPSGANSRAILRVHLHQLILSDHPNMSPEERRLVDLKISYAQYRALFKQRTLEYLMLRLLDLIEQLTKVFGFAALKAENEEEELLLMRRLYHDLIETLPALNELNQAMDGLTLSIYEGWREIVEIRRQSGVTNTAAHLTVRRIRSNLQTENRSTVHRRLAEHDNNEGGAAVGAAGGGADDFGTTDDEARAIEGEKIWNKLRHKLTNVPHLLQSVQRMLFKAVLEPSAVGAGEEGEENLLLSPRSGANREAERQAKLDQETRKLTKVVTVVTEARDQLLGSNGLVPPFALRLTEDASITPDNQLSAGEIKRRAALNQCKYKVVVRINNKVITSTDYFKLRVSSLSVDFKRHFEFRVLHQPYDVTLDLYQSRVNLLDPLETLLSSVSIPIPGVNSSHSGGGRGGSGGRGGAAGGKKGGAGGSGGGAAGGGRQTVTHSYAPILDWYSFASFAKPSAAVDGSGGSSLWGSGWFGSSAAAPPSDGEHPLSLAVRRTEGALLVTSEYDVSAVDHHTSGPSAASQGAVNYEGVRSEEIALIPPPKASGESVLTRGAAGSVGVAAGGMAAESNSVMSRVHDFTRENDFQQLLPDFNELDLNDPNNDHLLYLKSKRSSAGDDDVFRLSGFDYSVPFTTVEGVSYSNYARLKECNRMKLLRIRTVKPYLFTDPIPLSETLIKSSEAYKRIFSAEMEANAAALDPSQDPRFAVAQLVGGKESVNAAKVTSFLERVRSSQTAMNRRKRKKKVSTSSVVIETDYLVLEELDIDLLIERKRSLKPKVKARAPATIVIDSCDLLVQVVGARNIPLRSEFDYSSDVAAANKRLSKPKRDRGSSSRGGGLGGAGSESEGEANSDADNLLRRSRSSMNDTPIVSDHMLDERKMKEKRRAKTFVEVKFQDKVVATTAYDGGTPMWKQSVSLPFKPANDDFSPNSLDQCREDVHFTLFDEVCEDDAGKGGFLEGESTVRVEKRYLGSFSVPFATLYHEGRIDGVFRLDTPVMNIGYDHSSSYATRRQVDSGSMFVNEEDDQVLPSARGGAAGDAAGGGIQITGPFSAMYFLFDCFLKATTMPVTIAGKKSLSDSLYYSGSYIHQETQAEFSYFASSDKSTYIKLMLTFDPILVTNPVIEDDITTSTVIRDDRYLVLYNREWQASIHAIGPHTKDRTYKLFGTNSNGLNVLICRYLTPLKPPSGFMSRRGVLHLVSMIPFMKDAHSFIGEADLWCTCSQFWEIGAGDEEEHAVMLYNYLYYLSIASGDNKSMQPPAVKGKKKPPPGYPSDEAVRNECLFLVMGRAIPEGDTVYILMRDKRRKGNGYGPENFLVINPCNGYVYSAIDPNCPLRDIYCIATPYNIWGNVQVESAPSEMKYDVFASDQWRPLFGHRMKPPAGALNSIQDDIIYFESSAAYALEVEKSIHTQLRNSMRRWRSKRHRSTTTFHPDACNVMHELLPSLEQWKRSGATDGDPTTSQMDRTTSPTASSGKMDYAGALEKLQSDARERMRTLLRTRTLKGCPINVPFTDVDEIVNKIKTLCIHEAQHPEVQFVMAVRAFPIFNNILSVWIFVGTLETIG